MGRNCRNCYRCTWIGSPWTGLTKETKVAYALGVIGLLTALLAVMSGGRIGAGIVATVLAIVGAHKIDTLWNAYQMRR